MATTLKLIFEGLCGLIPWHDERDSVGADIVLVNAQFNSSLGLPEHVAMLEVLSGIVDGNDFPRLRDEGDVSVKGTAVRIGDGRPTNGSRGLKFVRDDESRTWQGLRWILDMGIIAPGCQPRGDLGIGGDGRVTAVMRLVDGALEAAPPSMGHSTVWSVGDKTVALTDRILYLRECADDVVELQFARLEPKGRRVGTIRVKPSDDQLVLRISNLPPMSPKHGGMSHVSAAYALFENVPLAAPAPEPILMGRAVALTGPAQLESRDDPFNCYHVKPPIPDPPPYFVGEFPSFE